MKTGRKPLYSAVTCSPRGGSPPRYMNMKQAAAYLNISESTLKKLRDAGGIPVQIFGRRTYRVSREALDRWLKKMEKKRERELWR